MQRKSIAVLKSNMAVRTSASAMLLRPLASGVRSDRVLTPSSGAKKLLIHSRLVSITCVLISKEGIAVVSRLGELNSQGCSLTRKSLEGRVNIGDIVQFSSKHTDKEQAIVAAAGNNISKISSTQNPGRGNN